MRSYTYVLIHPHHPAAPAQSKVMTPRRPFHIRLEPHAVGVLRRRRRRRRSRHDLFSRANAGEKESTLVSEGFPRKIGVCCFSCPPYIRPPSTSHIDQFQVYYSWCKTFITKTYQNVWRWCCCSGRWQRCVFSNNNQPTNPHLDLCDCDSSSTQPNWIKTICVWQTLCWCTISTRNIMEA